MALDANGNPESSKLYMPFGGWRWESGTLPTARQFTGQVADATSRLDYYNARYYDPALGQFTSADTVMDGLNRYAYVGNNPTTDTDPTGHFVSCFAVGQATTKVGGAAALVGCGLDAMWGTTQSLAESYYGMAVYGSLMARRTSGTYEFLSSQGARAVKAATSPRTMVSEMAKTFLPGHEDSSGDYVLEQAQEILGDERNLREAVRDPGKWGTRASEAFQTFVDETLPQWSERLKFAGAVGEVAGVVGAGLTGVAAGYDYYQQHANEPDALLKATEVGLVHAAASLAGAYVGGAIGATVGGLCGPLAVVCSPVLAVAGASAGAYGGDMAASWAVDNVENGNAGDWISNTGNAISETWGVVTTGVADFLGF